MSLDTIRHKIKNLKEELVDNLVSKSRHSEIIKLFENVLGDGPYYNVSGINPAVESFEILLQKDKPVELYNRHYRLLKPYKCYTSSTVYNLSSDVIKINGHYIKVIVQKIEPKTAYELYHMDEYTVYYFACCDIDNLR